MNNTSATFGEILSWVFDREIYDEVEAAFFGKTPTDIIPIDDILTNTAIYSFTRLDIVLRDYFFTDRELMLLMVYYVREILSYYEGTYPETLPRQIIDFLETSNENVIKNKINNRREEISALTYEIRKKSVSVAECDACFVTDMIKSVVKLYLRYYDENNTTFKLRDNIISIVSAYEEQFVGKVNLIQLTRDYIATL
jgi:hypothetical protein